MACGASASRRCCKHKSFLRVFSSIKKPWSAPVDVSEASPGPPSRALATVWHAKMIQRPFALPRGRPKPCLCARYASAATRRGAS